MKYSDTRGLRRRILPKYTVSLGTNTIYMNPRNSRVGTKKKKKEKTTHPHLGLHLSCSTCLLTTQKGKEREQTRHTAIHILCSATVYGHHFPARHAPAGLESNALMIEHCKLGPAASVGSCWIPGEPLAGRGLGPLHLGWCICGIDNETNRLRHVKRRKKKHTNEKTQLQKSSFG